MNKGYLTLIAAIFTSLMLSGALIFTDYVFNIRKPAGLVAHSLDARLIAEAGFEKAVWKLNENPNYAGETATAFGDGQFSVSVANLDTSTKRVTVDGFVPNAASPKARRRMVADVTTSADHVSFTYAVQVGDGGVDMGQDSKITGTVYSNGIIKGSSIGAQIIGDAYSARSSGKIDSVKVTSNARAHEIKNCTVMRDAYYQVITSCAVNGKSYPGSPDPAPQNFAITDRQLTSWKNQAAAGGTISGNYTLAAGKSGTLGPKKITGNLVMGKNATLTLSGTVWVQGYIDLDKDSTVRLDSAYGGDGKVIIADGIIDLSKEVSFIRAGAGDYIMVISTSSSAFAISIAKNADALIAYAPNGTIIIKKSVHLRQATGYRLVLEKDAEITYESGLADVNFNEGPGASWKYKVGTYFSE